MSSYCMIVFPPPPGSPPAAYNLADYYYNIANVDSALTCIIPQASSDINRFSVQMDSLNQSPFCWVFTQMVSAAVMSHYNDGNSFPVTTQDANATLNMLLWLTNSTQLHPAARDSGLGMISELPINSVVEHALTYILCNGMNCLITLPTYWQLSTAVSSFGYAMGAIMILLCTVTMFITFKSRKRVVIRSASVVFLQLMLIGLVLLYMSGIVLVQSPTLVSCGMFAWLANFGLELIFVPLFLKMYRIYKIFSRKQLKIVKISDMKLLSYGSVLLVFNLILMAVWQGVDGLQPITTHVYSGVNDTQYLQCNIPSNSTVYVIILGVEKAMLLLFGCVMSFSTRKVSGTFNESTSVAWSIYNTILATAILIPIIAFVKALGDTLIVLILIIILWIGVSIYTFVFGTKLYTLALGEAREQVSQLESNRTLTGGFSFVSIDALSKHTVTQYLNALRTHMRAVEVRAKQLAIAAEGNSSPLKSHVSTDNPSTKYRAVTSHDNNSTTGTVPSHNGNSVPYINKKYSINSYQHETIAPVRRDTPTFLPAANTNSGVLNARKLTSSSSVVAEPMFVHARSSSMPHTTDTDHTAGINDSTVG